MSELKVGDRVKVLEIDKAFVGALGATGVIVDIHGGYFSPYELRYDDKHLQEKVDNGDFQDLFHEDEIELVEEQTVLMMPNLKTNKNKQIESNFSYHAPKEGQPEKYTAIREKAKELAYLIHEICPESREKSVAMTKLEESVFWSNASVARNE